MSIKNHCSKTLVNQILSVQHIWLVLFNFVFNIMLAVIITFVLIQRGLSFDLPRQDCASDLKINNEQYNVTQTFEVGDASAIPTDAHYDEFGNLFFVVSGRNDKGFYFNIKLIAKNATASSKIYGLPEGNSYSIAVDRRDSKVYFGTGKGIYTFDYDTSTATPVSESSFKVDMIFVDRDGNKFVTESKNGVEELYLLNGRKKIRFHTLEALNELAIDERNNFYFIRENKFFVLKSDLSRPKYVGNVTYDGIAQISVYEGRVFIASENLLYFDENVNGNIESIDNVPGKATAIAFDDNGDFVLGIQSKLLKYNKCDCYFRSDLDNNSQEGN